MRLVMGLGWGYSGMLIIAEHEQLDFGAPMLRDLGLSTLDN